MKKKSHYQCSECSAIWPKWSGQCAYCEQWNTLVRVENIKSSPLVERFSGFAPQAKVVRLNEIELSPLDRYISSSSEFNRVFGGGLVVGSVVLIGGEPGIGKSTLLLQYLSELSAKLSVLYISGEESPQQIAMRAKRLEIANHNMDIMADNHLENIFKTVQQRTPEIIVTDSIQTFYSDQLDAAPGSVSQIRECAARLVRYAKQSSVSVILVGHVTKEGALAGPKLLEHMVDAVLYFEGDNSSSFRFIRAIKNRFGAVNEIGVFAMTDQGLKDVSNPSAMLISKRGADKPGSVALATQEGSRPLLVEIQALVDDSAFTNPRRLCIGLEQNRVAMLLAIAHRHAGISLNGYDVFTNVAGGIKISETGGDLAVLMAILSSVKNRALGGDLVIFGELGLSGEIRPVQGGQDRLREVEKMGFKRALIPPANKPKNYRGRLELITPTRIEQALDLFQP